MNLDLDKVMTVSSITAAIAVVLTIATAFIFQSTPLGLLAPLFFGAVAFIGIVVFLIAACITANTKGP